MLALVIFLRKRIGPLTGQGSKQGYVSVALCSLFAGVMTLLIGHFLLSDPTVSILLGKGGYVFSRSFITQLLQLFVMGGFFMLFLISYAWVFGVDEILTLVGVKKKVLPSPSSSMRS
jgi:hypothetical protein